MRHTNPSQPKLPLRILRNPHQRLKRQRRVRSVAQRGHGPVVERVARRAEEEEVRAGFGRADLLQVGVCGGQRRVGQCQVDVFGGVCLRAWVGLWVKVGWGGFVAHFGLAGGPVAFIWRLCLALGFSRLSQFSVLID